MKYSQIIKWVFLFIVWTFINSCAPSDMMVKTPPSPTDVQTKVGPISVIQKISFTEDENYTKIQITGSETMDSPFYKLLSDPLRIIIDVPNIDLKQIKDPLKIDNGTVGEVLATQFDDKGRIEIGLVQVTNYKILREDRNLFIDIEKVKTIAKVEEIKKEEENIKEKETALPPPEIKKEEITKTPTKETVTAEVMPNAKKILNILIDQKKDAITLNIIGDGKLGDFHSFKLGAPPRLVLDILGVDTSYPQKTININNPLLTKVRIGRHPDKLRFVFENPTPKLPPYQINRINEKLIVNFGKDLPISEFQKVSSPTLKTKEIPKTSLLKEINFKQIDNKSKITVVLTEEAEFESSKVGEKVIAVDIKNAFIPKHLQRALDTSEFESAVTYIDPINVKKDKLNQIRILITLKEMVPFEITKEAKTLFIDIEKPKKIESKMEALPETKKEVVAIAPKKEEIIKEEVKPTPEVQKSEKISPPSVKEPVIQPQEFKKEGIEKKVTEEGVPEKIYTGRRMSLDFKDADIKNILRLIAEVSNFNIIAGDDVAGKITMRLMDVPWDQALDIILQSKSLGMTKVGNVIRIAPLEAIKKEIQAELESRRAKEKLEDLVTELIPVNYASAKEILPQLKGILSDRGDVKVDDRTNILIVKDIARNISAAKELVKSLDTKTPQVLIEARIVEATLTFQRDLGIQWGFLATSDTDGKRVLSAGGGTKGESDLRGSAVSTRKLVNLPSGAAADGHSILEFLFTSNYGLRNLDLAISAYEKNGDANVISSPKIATLDNKEASIEQGLRIPYTKLTTEGTPTEDFIEANLKLTVTPHVTNDGYIRMSIKVKKDEPSDAYKSTSNTPSINKNEAVTEVLVKDNGVVAIAGIYTIKKEGANLGVPLFSKIPVLGWLFKKESKKDERKDLLIFISPKIFKEQG